MRRLKLSDDRILGGVCGGFAEYFQIDPTMMRIAFVVFILLGGSGILLYFIAWFLMPRE